MTLPVHVHEWEVWLSAAGRVDRKLEWREGLVTGDLVPEAMREEKGLTCHRNGVVVDPRTTPVRPGDHVDFAVRPADPVTLGSIVAGAQALGGTFWLTLAALVAINVALALLMPKPKGPKRRDDDDGAGSWSGPRNDRTEGQPIMIIYGETRAAPQVIDEFTRVQVAPPEAKLYTLMSFGEGPIYAIGNQLVDTPSGTPLESDNASSPLPTGLQVQGNNLQNFDGVRAWVRMGTIEQEAVPGFNLVATDYVVGQALRQEETTLKSYLGPMSSQFITNPYNSNAAGPQAVWDQYAVGFDMTEEADQFGVVVGFPQGLYSLTTNGGMADGTFLCYIRYRELDLAGLPITTGGDNGDGWVYVPPQPMLFTQQQNPFQKEYGGTFQDPQTFTPGTLGKSLDCDGANDYATTSLADAPMNQPADWAATQRPATMSFDGWIQLDGLSSGTAREFRPILEISDPSFTGRGLSLMIENVAVDFGWAYALWVPVFYIGSGVSRTKFYEHAPGGSFPPHNRIPPTSGTTAWHHLAFTYASGIGGNANNIRLSIYLNGVQVYQTTDTSPLRKIYCAGKALEMMRSRVFQATNYTNGRADEWHCWNKELTAAEVTDLYRVGNGNYVQTSPELVAGWHFDDLTPFTTAQDFGNFGGNSSVNDLLVQNGGTSGSVNGTVVTPGGAGADPKRGKFRVQVLRITLDSISNLSIDASNWDLLYGYLDDQLSYPTTPILATEIKATDQLNTSAPTITALVKGRLCPVWDGVSTLNPSITYQWTQNPAWIALDVITNKSYGRGQDFDLRTGVDLVSVKEVADYCDGFLYDGRGRTGIHESDNAVPIFDLRYDSTLFGGLGGIEIFFRTSPTVFDHPEHWVPGAFIGFDGIPFPSTGLSVDINATNVGGLEIVDILWNNPGWNVRVRWDAAQYGAPWADGGFLSTSLTVDTLEGTAAVYERRFQYDNQIDTFRPVWELLEEILSTARARPVKRGNRISFKKEAPRDPVGIVTMGSIVEGSFSVSYAGALDTPNSYQIDFIDRDHNYARSSISIDDEALDDTAAEEEMRREQISLEGVTRRSQVRRHGLFLLAVNRLLRRRGTFRTGLEALLYEVGDIVQISHDLMPWGQSGRVGTGSSTLSVVVDRQVTIVSGETYYVRVRSNASGQTGSGSSVSDTYQTVEVTEPAGTYPAGHQLAVASPGFNTIPARDDPFSLYRQGEEFLAQIVEIQLRPDFEREVTWLQYDAAVYDADLLGVDLPLTLQSTSPPRTDVLPAEVHDLFASELTRSDADGGQQSELIVTWTHEESTSSVLARSNVFARYVPQGSWEKVAEAVGAANGVRFRPRISAPGTYVEVAVQAVSVTGTCLRPARCPRTSVTLFGIFLGPAKPAALTATLEADRATYAITPSSDRGSRHELRRDGWILGQRVGPIALGQTRFGPTPNWAGGPTNARGESSPPLLLRAIDGRGQFSEALRLETFNPVVPGSVLTGGASQEDSAFASVTITGGATAVVDGRTIVEFTGSNLTMTLGSLTSAPSNGRGERQYVEFLCVADQVHPLTVEQAQLPIDSPLMDRWTAEGPLTLLDGEPANCTMLVEWRSLIALGGGTSDWSPYTPGIAFGVKGTIDFRVTVTRPNTDFNVRIYRMASRTSRVPKQRHERMPSKWTGTSRVLNHG